MERSHADRLVRRGTAKFDHAGRLVYLQDAAVLERNSNGGGPLLTNAVSEFCGRDAFPDRAVLPPRSTAASRSGYFRGPLRPPVTGGVLEKR